MPVCRRKDISYCRPLEAGGRSHSLLFSESDSGSWLYFMLSWTRRALSELSETKCSSQLGELVRLEVTEEARQKDTKSGGVIRTRNVGKNGYLVCITLTWDRSLLT